MATFASGQRFDARVEVHTGYDGRAAVAPFASAPTVTLTVFPHGDMTNGIVIGDAAFSPSGAPVTAVYGGNT
jgi:hypothetical protein